MSLIGTIQQMEKLVGSESWSTWSLDMTPQLKLEMLEPTSDKTAFYTQKD